MKKSYLILTIVIALALLAMIIVPKILNREKEDTQLVVPTKEKQVFFVDTKQANKFSSDSYIKKIGRVVSEEDIEIKSQANGKVTNIYVKEGDSIKSGKQLISLADSLSSYGLSLDRAKLNVEAAQLDYNQTKINLDKSIADAKLNVDKTKNEYEKTKESLEKNLEQAKLNLENSKEPVTDTTFELQKDKILNNVKKAELDIENLKNGNVQQLASFGSSTISSYNNLDNLMVNIIDFTDSILGVTDTNKRLNDDYDEYLGIKNRQQLGETEAELHSVIQFREEIFIPLKNLSQVDFSLMTLATYDELFVKGDDGYSKALSLLRSLTVVMDNSVTSVGSLSQAQIDGFKTQIKSYESQVLSNQSSYLSFKSSVKTFLNTYKDSENSAIENLKTLEDELNILEKNTNITGEDLDFARKNNEINLEKTKIDNKKTLKNLDIAVKNAEANYQNALKQKDVNLAKISNIIKVNKNSQSQASRELNKLGVTSPITGTVTDVLVDMGQDVGPGTPLIKVSSLGESAVEISLSEEEVGLLKVGDKVYTAIKNKKVEGKILSISLSADNNLNYKTKITFGSKFESLGNVVDLIIPVKISRKLLPLNIVEVTDTGKGSINTMSGALVIPYDIDLGEVWGDKIEVKTALPKNLDIITNSLANYNTSRFILQKRPDEIEEEEKEEREEEEKTEKKTDEEPEI